VAATSEDVGLEEAAVARCDKPCAASGTSPSDRRRVLVETEELRCCDVAETASVRGGGAGLAMSSGGGGLARSSSGFAVAGVASGGEPMRNS
jgi:hypothetical protein